MSFAQFAGHLLVAAVALAIALRQSSVMGMFMRLRPTSKLAVPGFFGLLAVEQVGTALEFGDGVQAAITLLLLAALIVMIVSVGLDARRVVVRFSNAVAAITEEFDGLTVCTGESADEAIKTGSAKRVHIGSTVLATINHALYGTD